MRMKKLRHNLGILICIAVTAIIAYTVGLCDERTEYQAERLPESIKDIQRKIGAEPDGIWGPRTQAYYDEWYKNESGGYWCRKAGM